MKILARQVVNIFGHEMVAELIEYEIDITSTSHPYKMEDGKRRYTTKRKIRLVSQPAFSKYDKVEDKQ